MINKKLYPKTSRFGLYDKTIITEKVDGSNVGFFKYENELYVAQRNFIYKAKDAESLKDILYKGMLAWLNENAAHLEKNLHQNSGFFGEWLGMGKLNYKNRFTENVLMFAKFNITPEMEVQNMYYDPELLIYPFLEQKIPEYIGKVPLVSLFTEYPSIRDLDDLFLRYENNVDSLVEGFILINNNQVVKYVRRKSGGKLEPHRADYKD